MWTENNGHKEKTIFVGNVQVTIVRPELTPEEEKKAEDRIKAALVNYERNDFNAGLDTSF